MPLPLDHIFQQLTHIVTFFWRPQWQALAAFLEKASIHLAGLKNTVISHLGRLARYLRPPLFPRQSRLTLAADSFTGTLFAANSDDDIFLAIGQ